MNARRLSTLVGRFLVLFVVAACSWSVSAASYYVSWSTGNDSNPGTKAQPWKRSPFQPSFGGSYSPVAGDRFIFRGGETYPRTAFPLAVTQGGSSDSNRNYIGVDQTWFAGGSWSRPVFDGEGVVIGPDTQGALMRVSVSNLTIDGIEFIRMAGLAYQDGGGQWQIQNGAMGVVMGGVFLDNITITNSIFRDWRMVNQAGTIYTGGSGWDGNGLGGVGILSGNWGGNILVTDCVAHQDNVAQKSGTSFRQVPWVRRSRVWNTTQAVLGGYRVEYCEFFNFPDPTDGLAHNNAIELFGPGYIFANLIHDLSNYTAPMLIAADWGGVLPSAPTFIINNVLWNVGWQIPIGLDTGGNPSQSEFYVWNNTVFDDGSCVGTTGRNATPYEVVDIRNNHFITQGNPISMLSPATTYIENNNTTQTQSAASAQGYTSGNIFQPTSGSGATVGAGVNLSQYYSTDRLGNQRTVPWDTGAYEFSGIPSPGNLAFTLSSTTTQEDIVLSVGISRHGGTSGTVGVSYQTSNGTATAGTDYTAASGTVSLGSGVSSGSFNVTILRNVAHTGNLYFTITISNPTGGAELASPSTITVTIIDSDPPPSSIPELGLSFAAADMLMVAPFENNGGLISQPIETVSTNAAGKLMANIVFSVAGSYKLRMRGNYPHGGANSFYVQILGTNDVCHLNPFTSGIEDRYATYQGTGNYVTPEFNPMVWTFSAPSTNLLVIYGLEAGTVLESLEWELEPGPTPPQQISLGTSTASVVDAGISVQIPVMRVGSSGTVTVDYETADGTAVAGVDYTDTNGTLTFDPGETNLLVAIPITNHATYEGNKEFTLTISNPSVAAELAPPTVCTITIIDDLDPPLPFQAAVVSVSAPTIPNPSYIKAGGVIPIRINISSNATVTGTPQLILNTGAVASYSSGSGSSNLVFTYTVGSGQNSSELDYLTTESLLLNGGSIVSGGNSVSLSLATPGATGSISAAQAIIIDTTPPVITIGTPTYSSFTGPLNFPVTYSDRYLNTVTLAANNVGLNKTGTANADVVTVEGSGGNRLVKLFGLSGNGTIGISISAGTATDLAGNVAGSGGPSPTAILQTSALTIIRDATIRSGTIGGQQ